MQVLGLIEEPANGQMAAVTLLVSGSGAGMFNTIDLVVLVADGGWGTCGASGGDARENFYRDILYVRRFVTNSIGIFEGERLTAALFCGHATNVNAGIPFEDKESFGAVVLEV